MKKAIIYFILIGIIFFYGDYSFISGSIDLKGVEKGANKTTITIAVDQEEYQEVNEVNLDKEKEEVALVPGDGESIIVDDISIAIKDTEVKNNGDLVVKVIGIPDEKETEIKISNDNEVNVAALSEETENGMGPIPTIKDEPMEQIDNQIERVSILDKIREYTVSPGDNLWNIAKANKVDVDTLIGANDITDMNRIKPGDVIKILPIKGILYRINPGESLWTIARSFDVNLNKIVALNNIDDPDLVKPGKTIIIPGAKPELGFEQRISKKFIAPVSARISSPYGMRWGKLHEGIDYAVNTGTSVKAARDGKIIYSGWSSGYGKTVVIEHRKGVRTLYAHNSELIVYGGQWVKRGQTIAKSGNTGKSTGPHLHFEIQINGKPVNPLNYLR